MAAVLASMAVYVRPPSPWGGVIVVLLAVTLVGIGYFSGILSGIGLALIPVGIAAASQGIFAPGGDTRPRVPECGFDCGIEPAVALWLDLAVVVVLLLTGFSLRAGLQRARRKRSDSLDNVGI